MKIGYIVGSLSTESINRRLATAVAQLIGVRAEVTEIPIGDLPLFNRDLEAQYPESATSFKEAVRAQDGVFFVTPEYNRSIPASLKNAIDWGSRPHGESAFSGIPSAVMGITQGTLGTALAQQHLRNLLTFLNMPLLGQPEIYLRFDSEKFGDDDSFTDDGLLGLMERWCDVFLAHVALHADS